MPPLRGAHTRNLSVEPLGNHGNIGARHRREHSLAMATADKVRFQPGTFSGIQPTIETGRQKFR
ncbi:MAG: hypothetical protein K6U02_03970 [Firmicutes bacterium]|nr:hypothetical protein [Bacillota bacterium]